MRVAYIVGLAAVLANSASASPQQPVASRPVQIRPDGSYVGAPSFDSGQPRRPFSNLFGPPTSFAWSQVPQPEYSLLSQPQGRPSGSREVTVVCGMTLVRADPTTD